MNEGLISRRYAKALYQYAVQRNEEQALYLRMKALIEHLRTLPELHETLCSPMVSPGEKAMLLRHAAQGNPEESYLGFVRLILDNHREKSLTKIALSYTEYYLRKKRISVIHLTFATEMPQKILSHMQDDFAEITRGEVELSVQIDPSIRGGFIFRINDLRLDASVAGQLARMRKQILQENKYSL
ncbi:MAG: F0F1 ATP synthase subunit delta [Tannerella sp.]|jgi:F-type H+-transporting ATPase subunit delta|nr:F0F1 ATP synthase subunit delta [Tannerella sp.]